MENLFRQLGFNDNEREVYLAVFTAGKISPHQIAQKTGINRTTVYSIAKKLSKTGIIIQDLGQKVSYLVAAPPEKLISLFEKEEKKLKEKKKTAQTLIRELSCLQSEKHYSVPRIRFIEESYLESYLYEAYPRWASTLPQNDPVWRGFQDDTFTHHYKKWIDWTWTHHANERVHVEFFLNKTEIERLLLKKHPARRMKVLPKNVSFSSSFWVTGEYLIMAQTQVRPHYLVEIHDPILAHNQQALFRGLWSLAQKT